MKVFANKKEKSLALAVALLTLGAFFAGVLIGKESSQREMIVQSSAQVEVQTEAQPPETQEEQGAQEAQDAQEEPQDAQALQAEIYTQAAFMAKAMLAAEDSVYLTLNGYDLYLDWPQALEETTLWVETTQLSTELPTTLQLGLVEGYTVYVENVAVESYEQITFQLETLSQTQGIEIKLVDEATKAQQCYYIRTLPLDYSCTAVGEGTGDGYYYFRDEATIYKMDTNGNIVFYKVAAGNAFDFKRTEIDGAVYYSYLEAGDAYTDATLDSVGYVQCRAVVMDEAYQVIDTVDFLADTQDIQAGHSIENHEFIVLGEAHYLLSAYVGKQVENIPAEIEADGTANVVASVIQEVKDGELLFQWDSTDYPELYALSVDKNDFTNQTIAYADYAHYNSAVVDPADGNLILSFRNLDAALKISRETGDILWILGGLGDQFGLTEEQKFSRQHFVKFSDENTLVIFDNGEANEQSRAIELMLDEENLQVLAYDAYAVEGRYSPTMGSAQRVSEDANIFVMGWGDRGTTSIVFSEVDFDTNEILFEVSNEKTSYSAGSYRVYKFES